MFFLLKLNWLLEELRNYNWKFVKYTYCNSGAGERTNSREQIATKLRTAGADVQTKTARARLTETALRRHTHTHSLFWKAATGPQYNNFLFSWGHFLIYGGGFLWSVSGYTLYEWAIGFTINRRHNIQICPSLAGPGRFASVLNDLQQQKSTLPAADAATAATTLAPTLYGRFVRRFLLIRWEGVATTTNVRSFTFINTCGINVGTTTTLPTQLQSVFTSIMAFVFFSLQLN